MSEPLPPWPDDIKRVGAYKVYKDVQYAVYDDGNSADTAYNFDLSNAAIARLKMAVELLQSSECGSCAWHADKDQVLTAIGPIPE